MALLYMVYFQKYLSDLSFTFAVKHFFTRDEHYWQINQLLMQYFIASKFSKFKVSVYLMHMYWIAGTFYHVSLIFAWKSFYQAGCLCSNSIFESQDLVFFQLLGTAFCFHFIICLEGKDSKVLSLCFDLAMMTGLSLFLLCLTESKFISPTLLLVLTALQAWQSRRFPSRTAKCSLAHLLNLTMNDFAFDMSRSERHCYFINGSASTNKLIAWINHTLMDL